MNALMAELFPDYTPFHLEEELCHRLNSDGEIQFQLFGGLVSGHVAGVLKTYYREWRNALVQCFA